MRIFCTTMLLVVCSFATQAQERPRARDIGLVVGTLPVGKLNAITDVKGVRVGHATVIEGDDVRTGVTAIIPADGDLYWNPVPAWIHSANGYGNLVGETQVREFGEIETPILLTCTLCVWKAAQALAEYELAHVMTSRKTDKSSLSIIEQIKRSPHFINPIVGETNDSRVNNIWKYPVNAKHVRRALDTANSGKVEEGSIGAGTGTRAFAWKGGIGTSSRVLPEWLGGHTVGVLVQTNFGGDLRMNGAPVGRELGDYALRNFWEFDKRLKQEREAGEGSIMIVIATDAPLTEHALERLSKRTLIGLARTGSYVANESGDYVIAFSTAESVRRDRLELKPKAVKTLMPIAMTPLFTAAADATEEAIYNAILTATTITSNRGELSAIPLEETISILKKYKVLNWDKTLPLNIP